MNKQHVTSALAAAAFALCLTVGTPAYGAAAATTQAVVAQILATEGIIGNPSLSIVESPKTIQVNLSLLQKTKDSPAGIAKQAAAGLHALHPAKRVTVSVSSYGLDKSFHYVLVDRKDVTIEAQSKDAAPTIEVPQIHL